MVVVSVSPGVTAYFMSRPTAAPGSDGFISGLPLVRCRVRSVTAYGISSSRFGDAVIDRPPSSPNDDT